MADKIDLSQLNMPEDELFAPVDINELESEKITAPRLNYLPQQRRR